MNTFQIPVEFRTREPDVPTLIQVLGMVWLHGMITNSKWNMIVLLLIRWRVLACSSWKLRSLFVCFFFFSICCSHGSCRGVLMVTTLPGWNFVHLSSLKLPSQSCFILSGIVWSANWSLCFSGLPLVLPQKLSEVSIIDVMWNARERANRKVCSSYNVGVK